MRQPTGMRPQRLREGAGLYPVLTNVDASEVYRYAPWFAWLTVPWTYLPQQVAGALWSAVLLVGSGRALVPLVRARALGCGRLLRADPHRHQRGRQRPAADHRAAGLDASSAGAARSGSGSSPPSRCSRSSLRSSTSGEGSGFGRWRPSRSRPSSGRPRSCTTSPATRLSRARRPRSSPCRSCGRWWWERRSGFTLRLARTPFGWLAAATTVVLALPRLFVYDVTYLMTGVPADNRPR